MYLIGDKQAYVSRIQKMLGIPQSGRLDRRTRLAILSVKNQYELSETPLVDYKTFLAIKDYARNAKINVTAIMFRPFDVSERMRGINGMLGVLISHYSLLCRIPKGSVYGYDTQQAVARLREIYRIKNVNVIDGEFLYYVKKDISSFNANYNLENNG